MNPLTQFKKIRILPLLIALALAVAAAPRIARADAVLDWNDHAANAIVAVAAMPPPRGLIRLAMVHVAIYDAVDAIEGYPFTSVRSQAERNYSCIAGSGDCGGSPRHVSRAVS